MCLAFNRVMRGTTIWIPLDVSMIGSTNAFCQFPSRNEEIVLSLRRSSEGLAACSTNVMLRAINKNGYSRCPTNSVHASSTEVFHFQNLSSESVWRNSTGRRGFCWKCGHQTGAYLQVSLISILSLVNLEQSTTQLCAQLEPFPVRHGFVMCFGLLVVVSLMYYCVLLQ